MTEYRITLTKDEAIQLLTALDMYPKLLLREAGRYGTPQSDREWAVNEAAEAKSFGSTLQQRLKRGRVR